MASLLARVGDFMAQQRVERQFRRLIGRHLRPQGYIYRTVRSLNDDERAVLQQGIIAGLPARLKPGVIDPLASTPELAMALLEHGAIAGAGFLAHVQEVIRYRGVSLGRQGREWAWRYPADRLLVDMVNKLGALHPELDWFAPSRTALGYLELMPKNLGYHFPDVAKIVLDARDAQGIAFGPLHASGEHLDALVDELFSSDWRAAGPGKEHIKGWLDGLLARGADPNRVVSTHLGPLCLLARAAQVKSEWMDVVLAHDPRVDRQVLMDVLRVMQDDSPACNKLTTPPYLKKLEQLMERSSEPLDLGALVPRWGQHKPRTVEEVLAQEMPSLLDAVRWRSQVNLLERETVAAAEPVASAPRRRL